MKVDSVPAAVIGRVVTTLLDGQLKKVTAYLSPTLTVKATRKLFGQKIDKRSSSVDVVLTIGSPNYEEREFIKACKKSGEPFPVKKLQIKAVPSKKHTKS